MNGIFSRVLQKTKKYKIENGFQNARGGVILEPGKDLELLFLQMEEAVKTTDCIAVTNADQKKGVECCIEAFIRKYRILIKKVVRSFEDDYITQIILKGREKKKSRQYMDIQTEYDENYYMNDCGGYEEFKRTKGHRLDSRLLAFMNLVAPNSEDRILDVGCGRGEFAYACSAYAKKVTGIDYSNDAIRIAKENFGKCEAVRSGKLKYITGDILMLNTQEKYTKIVMADVYEHIEPEIMEKLLQKIGQLLAENGVIYIHTAPNLDYYEKVYAKQVKEAYRRGEFLPANPRSRYEDRMHINEQSPGTLKSALERYFTDVYVWSGIIHTKEELTDLTKQNVAIDITAVAGENLKQETVFKMASYGRLDTSGLRVSLHTEIKSICGDGRNEAVIPVQIHNTGSKELRSQMPHPVYLSYHIVGSEGSYVQYDGIRTPLQNAVYPQNCVTESARVILEDLPEGDYFVEIDLVQEGCFWFQEITGHSLKVELKI